MKEGASTWGKNKEWKFFSFFYAKRKGGSEKHMWNKNLDANWSFIWSYIRLHANECWSEDDEGWLMKEHEKNFYFWVEQCKKFFKNEI